VLEPSWGTLQQHSGRLCALNPKAHETVKLSRGGEGNWQSGSDDPKVVDVHGWPDRASDLQR
jgi:hypothetical protein